MNFESFITDFLTIVKNPKITIRNFPTEWQETNELGVFKYQENDTEILYNEIKTISKYRLFLAEKSAIVLNSLIKVLNKRTGVFQISTVSVFQKLVHPEDFYIEHHYEVVSIASDMEFLVEQNGILVLLKEHNNKLIKQLDDIGRTLYKELYFQLDKIIAGTKESWNDGLKSNYDMNDTEKFFELLFESKQHFYLDLTYINENLDTGVALYFAVFDNPNSFQEYCYKYSIKAIFEFNNDLALNKINSDFILNHIERLQNTINSYQLTDEANNQIIPKNYLIDNYLVTPADSMTIEQLEKENKANFFLYNKIKYLTIKSLIAKFFKILNPEDTDTSITPISKSNIGSDGFKGIAFKQSLSDELLYKIFKLWNKNIIETDFIIFKMAFTGQTISNPVRIKWLLKHRGNPVYYALFYFLSSNIFGDIPDDKLFIKTCFFTFVTATEKDFNKKSFETSYSKFNKQEEMDKVYQSNQSWKRTLDDIIERTNLLTKLP